MEPVDGLYLGTERGGRWWRRYTAPGFLARGNGRMWSDVRGLWFHKLLSRSPLHIPWERIESIDVTAWHAGRWAWGLPIVRVAWRESGEALASGFLVGSRRQDGEAALQRVRSEWSERSRAA